MGKDLNLESAASEASKLLCEIKEYLDAFNQDYAFPRDIEKLEVLGDQVQVLIHDICRKVRANLPQPKGASCHDYQKNLGVYIMNKNAPWLNLSIDRSDIPGMITDEEVKYYNWLPRFYGGKGRVVELGPWLGASTVSIIDGFKTNLKFAREKLLVFDDFVWRKDWMDPYVEPKHRLPNHTSFKHLFQKYTSAISGMLSVHHARFAIYDGNELVPKLTWDFGPIEQIYVDCGRTIEANEGWYSALSKYFIPEMTLIVMQDWRLHRELPKKWYNQTNLFTDSKGEQLRLIHELNDGGVATFLYTGKTRSHS